MCSFTFERNEQIIELTEIAVEAADFSVLELPVDITVRWSSYIYSCSLTEQSMSCSLMNNTLDICSFASNISEYSVSFDVSSQLFLSSIVVESITITDETKLQFQMNTFCILSSMSDLALNVLNINCTSDLTASDSQIYEEFCLDSSGDNACGDQSYVSIQLPLTFASEFMTNNTEYLEGQLTIDSIANNNECSTNSSSYVIFILCDFC